MANKTGAAFGSEVAVTACGTSATDTSTTTTDTGVCKTAFDLFTLLGMRKYEDQAALSSMFSNNAWDAAGTGTSSIIGNGSAETDTVDTKKRSIMDVFILTKTNSGAGTDWTTTATTGESIIWADAFAYA